MISLDASVRKLTAESAHTFLVGRHLLRDCCSSAICLNLAAVMALRQLPVVSIPHRFPFARRSTISVPRSFAVLEGAAQRLADAREAVLARQIAIAGIPAPTGNESARADALVRWLSVGTNHAVRRDAAGNVIARLGCPLGSDDEHAPVVVMAHLDTVFEHVKLPQREGSRVVMPGIGDNGRGLAALVALSDALTANDIASARHRPIELVATVGEEGAGNLRGARAYLDDLEVCRAQKPAAVIALDGPGDALVVHHAIASRRLRVSITAEGGHPWADVDRANAVHVAGRAIASMAQLASAQPSGVTVTVTRVGGGESLTSIPAHAWFDVDLRALDASAIPRLHEILVRLSRRAAADAGNAIANRAPAVSFEVLGDRPGGAIDVRHPLVQLAFDATNWQGREPRSASSSSDANIALSRGIPAITIGAGGIGGGAHTEHEWYDDVASERGLARALAIVVELANRSPELAAN